MWIRNRRLNDLKDLIKFKIEEILFKSFCKNKLRIVCDFERWSREPFFAAFIISLRLWIF